MSAPIVFCRYSLDSMLGGAIVRFADPDAWTIPIPYGHDIPWTKLHSRDTILLIGVTFPQEDLIKLAAAYKVVVFTVDPEELVKLQHCPNVAVEHAPDGSLGMLVWRYLYDQEPAPRVVIWTDDFFTWRHQHRESIPFNHGLNNLKLPPYPQAEWDQLMNDDRELLDRLIADGKRQLDRSQAVYDELFPELMFPTELNGHRLLGVNLKTPNSLPFIVYKHRDRLPEHDGYLTYRRTPRGYRVSVYRAPGAILDCQALVRQYQGGGRPGAAGFTCATLPFPEKFNLDPNPLEERRGEIDLTRILAKLDKYKLDIHHLDANKLAMPGKFQDEPALINNFPAHHISNHLRDAASMMSAVWIISYCWTGHQQYRVALEKRGNDPTPKVPGWELVSNVCYGYTPDLPFVIN